MGDEMEKEQQEVEAADAPETETPEERFVRLGVARTIRVLNGVRLIGNLSSPNYEWSDEQVDHIFNTIGTALVQERNKFRAGASKREVLFEL